MKKEEVMKLAEKLNINKAGLELKFKEDSKGAEKLVVDAAKFMGIR